MNKRPPWLIYFGPSQQNTKPHGSSPAGAVGQPKGASVTRPYVPGVGYVSPRNMGGPRHNLGYRYGAGLRNYISPIKGLGIGDFSDGYGPRTHPITGRYSFHTGADLPASLGTPIVAPSGGIVLKTVAGDSVYGNQIILDHGRHTETMYGHLNQFVVAPGERVKRGQLLGYVGSTGMSTGPHLHFETWNNFKPVNPTDFFKVLG